MGGIFVPMIGDLFLIPMVTLINYPQGNFRPHDWGSFFNLVSTSRAAMTYRNFRPHDWGSFFNLGVFRLNKVGSIIFVPMIGDLFLILFPPTDLTGKPNFRPHDWGSFFNSCVREAR